MPEPAHPRAMIVDDARAMRGLLRQCLRKTAYAVTEAGDGEEALRQLREQGGADLILLDWNMPNMDGLTFLKCLRADPAHDRTLVVMVTTESDQERLREALSAGANEYLMKPLTEEMVLEKLRLLMTDLV